MFLKKVKKLKLYGTIFLFSLFVVLLVRSILVQSYTVSSSQMETALFRGDRVFVNKLSYGVRLPMTLLSIPFTFDKFLGLKSYSNLVELNYHRFFKNRVERNDIVLFNNPLEIEKSIDKRSLVLSRCVALPGDTIYVKGNDLSINGKKYIPSPDVLSSYRFKKENLDSITSVMSMFNVPIRSLEKDSLWGYISLNKHEMFILNQKLSPTSSLEPRNESQNEYSITIPSKGDSILLTPFNVRLFASIISQESLKRDSMKVYNNIILKNNAPLTSYQFKDDYYWFVSDNVEEGVDSRSLGFISEKYVIGKASFIWYSSDEKGISRDRVFRSIK